MKNKAYITTPIFAAVIFLVIPLSQRLLALGAPTSSNLMLAVSAVGLLVFALPAAFYCKLRGLSLPRHSKMKGIHLSDIPFSIAAAFTYFSTAMILLYIEYKLFPTASGTTARLVTGSATALEMALAYVIIPAFAEELFFRSIILSDYAECRGTVSVMVSALFFAMLHFSFAHFPLYFILGIILGMMTYVTDSSITAVTVHLINNAVTVFAGEGAGMFLRDSSSSIILAFILVVVFLVSLISMLSAMEDVYERRSILYENGTLPGSRRQAAQSMTKAGKVTSEEAKRIRVSAIFLSPTMLVCVLVFVLATLNVI